jgi:predicted protein tyrosine phosphatase
MSNFLFVCSKNKWRSRTAEVIFKNTVGISVKSAGTNNGARIKLELHHLLWADLIFVMENKHRDIIQEKFKNKIDKEKIIVLEIQDDYPFMDDELILSLQSAIEPFLPNI